jgi:TRAP-type C4-dicarboxylate transport system permease small subunit
MSNFVKRWIVYLLIPAGLVLLFLPLNTHRTEDVKRDFVLLEISEALAEKISVKNSSVASENPDEKKLHQYFNELQKVVSGEHLSVATTANQYGYPIIQKQTLAAYPVLLEHIDHMLQIDRWSEKQIRSSRLDNEQVEKEWNAFKKSFLDDTNGAAFQYGNHVFNEHVKSGYSSIQVEIKNLKIAYKVTGGILLLLGLFAWRGMYAPPSEGIQIGKRSGIILWDCIVIGFGVFFTWGLLDALLSKYFQTSSVLGDEPMGLYMGAFWVIFGNLVMALFVTTTAIQTLLITREDITVKGLWGEKKLSWSNIQDIQLTEYFVPRKVYGVFTPRKVTKILKISGRDSSTLRIMEPPFSTAKKEIINKLSEYASAELQQTILAQSKEWLSIW